MADISPSWVTTLLRGGEVLRVEQEELPAKNSRITRLRLTYADPNGGPASMILKRNLPVAWAVRAGAEEVRFYRTVGGIADHPPLVPRCYAGEYDPTTGDSHLLLEDLSASHVPASAVPDPATIDGVVDTLARIHAYWWDGPLLQDGVVPVLDWNGDTARYAEYQRHRGRSWQRVAPDVPSELRRLVADVFGRLPAHWDRFLADRVGDRRQLTLLHGDCYLVSFMTPRPGTSGDTYLIDWQCPTGNLGAHDLVNLCATFWTREQRRDGNREERILRRYHQGLLDHGVTGYGWEQLLDDYRSGLVYWLLVPIQDAYGGAGPDYWLPKLRCLADAFEDWNAGELL